MVFSGNCRKDYFVVLAFRQSGDYAENPRNFVYNKAFPCQSGNYHYELKDLSVDTEEGIYYFMVAEEGLRGPWQPITALQPVRIEAKYK